MRKILMFGTMLGVASAAFAFGGMFSHGSKSTTYKGGVSAIGVHFGGEKSTDSKEDATESCATGILKDRFGHCNICENGNVYFSYMDDPCGTEIEITGCISNENCDENEYCKLLYRFAGWYSRDPLSPEQLEGACIPLTGGESRVYNGQEFFVNLNDYINYFTAENWCRAYGKTLASLSDLGLDINHCENIDWDELNSVFNGNVWPWVKDIAQTSNNFFPYYAYLINNSGECLRTWRVDNGGPSGGAICK